MTEPTNAEEAIALSKEDIAALHDPEVRKEYLDSWNRAQHHLGLVEEREHLKKLLWHLKDYLQAMEDTDEGRGEREQLQIELQLMRETDL